MVRAGRPFSWLPIRRPARLSQRTNRPEKATREALLLCYAIVHAERKFSRVLNVGRSVSLWAVIAWGYLLAHSIDGVNASSRELVMSVEELLIIAGAGVGGGLGFLVIGLAYLFVTAKEVEK